MCPGAAVLVAGLVMGVPGLESRAEPGPGVGQIGIGKGSDGKSQLFTIPEAELRQWIDDANPERKPLDPAAVEELVRKELLRAAVLAELRASRFDQREQVKRAALRAADSEMIARFMAEKSAIPAGWPSDGELRQVFEANRASLVLPRRLRVAQIFLAGTGEDRKARAETLASGVLKQPDSFAAVAKRESQHAASASNGGDMGWVPVREMLPEIVSAVESLPPNGISGVVATRSGFHILRLLDRREEGPATFEEVRAELVRTMRQRRVADQERIYLEEIARNGALTIHTETLKKFVTAYGQGGASVAPPATPAATAKKK